MSDPMSDSMTPRFIYLASQSPRRSELLTQIGVTHRLLLANKNEDIEQLEERIGRESPKKYVQRVTQLKLDAASARHRRLGLAAAPILCADTTVALGREILGKPSDAPDAVRMLVRLAGREHRVLTAVALQFGERRLAALSESVVRFEKLSLASIQAYVDSGEPFGKAGGYGIQGKAATLIPSLRGSYSGVMGLPLYQTANLLRSIGWML
jgi:septum formation protein